jgi:hypothetical protein
MEPGITPRTPSPAGVRTLAVHDHRALLTVHNVTLLPREVVVILYVEDWLGTELCARFDVE